MNRLAYRFALLAAVSTPAASQSWTQAPLEIVSDLGNDIRAIADFDLDGNLDLVVMQANLSVSGMSSFRVHYGQNDGSYVQGPTTSAFPVGYEAEYFTLAGDVTGDGLPDLVTSLREINANPGHGFLLYEGLGAGGFAAPVHTLVGSLPRSAVLTDWDGDGTHEIVELHSTVSIRGMQRWTYAGGGSFTATPEVTSTSWMESLDTGDLNGDSIDDIVSGSSSGAEFFVIESLPNGDLAPIVPYTVGPPTGFIERCASCGDIDGDGDCDVVVGWVSHNFTSHSQTFYNDGTGALTGGIEQTYQAEPGGYAKGLPHLVDWDLDGDLDALMAWHHVLFLENLGTGTFAYAGAIRVAQRPAGGGVTDGNNGVSTTDVNGDSFPDFVAGRVVKFGNGQFDRTPYPGPIPAHRPVDLDRDGDLDFLEAGGELLENDGTGRLTDRGEQWPPVPDPEFYQQAQAFGDFTGNGYEDMVTTLFRTEFLFSTVFLGMRMLEGNGDGVFRDVGMPTAAVTHMGDFTNFEFVQRDLDGDSDIDLAQIDGWWENDGTGFFPTLHMGAWAGRPELSADIDGNGTFDVITSVVSGVTTKSFTLQRNQGGATFVPEVLAVVNDATGIGNTAYLVDIDGDGDLDFAVGSDASGPQILIRENQSGAFGPVVTIPSSGYAWQTLVFEDLDDDGDLDLLGAPRHTPGHVGDTAIAWLQDGHLSFVESQRYLVDDVDASADLDGDGDVEFYDRGVIYETWRFDGTDAGFIRQYGAPQPGDSGVGPLLGMRGPARAGETVELRFRRAPGGAPAGLGLGISETSIPNFPLPGLTLLIDPLAVMIPLTLGGPPGVAGEGFLHLSIPIQASTAGQTYFHQAFFIDGGTIAGSNGLEVRYGM